MLTIALALGASLSWGFADFFGPLKGRALGALRVLLYVQLGGLLAIAGIVAIRARGPASAAALFAVPAAISGTLGLYAYYRGIAVGAMSVVAPIAGVSAAVPVVVGIASGDHLSVLTASGIACALTGVGLAAREPGHRGPQVAAGVGLALLALIGIGDMLGNLLFAAASRGGLVSVTSVLASLYPIVTVVLARVILAERVARSQEVGVVLTLAGVALISAG